ncbi:MAG: hypothetical protein QOI56_842 [Actinomycetota bacterium]|nr:hypothetical protein [Actinomycetota bacterium]
MTTTRRAPERFVFGPGTGRRMLVTQAALAAVIGLRVALGPYSRLAGQPAALFRPVSFLRVLHHMPGTAVIVGLQVVGTVAAVLAVGRRRRRATFPVAWTCLLVLAGLRSSRGKFLHNDALLLLAAVPFLLAPAGRWRDRASASPSVRFGWPVRTALVVVAGAYFFSGLAKLTHSGAAWVTTDNMRYVLYEAAAGGRVAFPDVPAWLAGQAWLAHVLAAAVLLLELTFPVVLLVHGRPGRRIGAFYAAAAVAFHAGTWLALGLDYWAWAAVVVVVVVDWTPLVERWADRVRDDRDVALAQGSGATFVGEAPGVASRAHGGIAPP